MIFLEQFHLLRGKGYHNLSGPVWKSNPHKKYSVDWQDQRFFLEGLCFLKFGLKHLFKKNFILTVKHGRGSVMVHRSQSPDLNQIGIRYFSVPVSTCLKIPFQSS